MKEAIRRMFGMGKPSEDKMKDREVKPASEAASAPSPAKKPNRENFLNPREVNARREREAGLACGGKVKKYTKGGSVRGTGCAVKGKKFSGTY
jgi:hypothetical protein